MPKTDMKYIVTPRAARKIYTFYGNVAKKYRHTYDKADYKRNVHDALKSIYDIENTLTQLSQAQVERGQGARSKGQENTSRSEFPQRQRMKW